MSWLVTGGAGYIGSHVVRAFGEVGLEAVVVDDLSSGHRDFVRPDVPLVEGSIVDTDLMARTMEEHAVEGVVHLAGFKYAGVSVDRPLHTYTQNVTGTVSLLEAMERVGADKIVFSSSAATFGTPDVDLVTEETPTLPESPYGESKLIGEWVLRDQARATGLRHTSLRYFNVVGSGSDDLYDTSPHNLFPIVFEMLLAGQDAADQRRRLRHPRRHLRARLRPRRRPRALPRRRRAAAERRRGPAARLQPRQRRGLLGRRDHGRHPRRHRHRLHPRGRHRGGPATRTASWPPARPPAATSTGACGTRCDDMVRSAWQARSSRR